jgi:hypothetical protein
LPFRATPDLRQSTLKKDAAQGGGGDTDSPRSETQTDEGIRAFTQLDDEAEKKLLAGAAACNWRKRSLQLFRDIIVLMRDTGMRNERELYRIRTAKHTVDGGREASLEIVRPVSAGGSKLWV